MKARMLQISNAINQKDFLMMRNTIFMDADHFAFSKAGIFAGWGAEVKNVTFDSFVFGITKLAEHRQNMIDWVSLFRLLDKNQISNKYSESIKVRIYETFSNNLKRIFSLSSSFWPFVTDDPLVSNDVFIYFMVDVSTQLKKIGLLINELQNHESIEFRCQKIINSLKANPNDYDALPKDEFELQQIFDYLVSLKNKDDAKDKINTITANLSQHYSENEIYQFFSFPPGMSFLTQPESENEYYPFFIYQQTLISPFDIEVEDMSEREYYYLLGLTKVLESRFTNLHRFKETVSQRNLPNVLRVLQDLKATYLYSMRASLQSKFNEDPEKFSALQHIIMKFDIENAIGIVNEMIKCKRKDSTARFIDLVFFKAENQEAGTSIDRSIQTALHSKST